MNVILADTLNHKSSTKESGWGYLSAIAILQDCFDGAGSTKHRVAHCQPALLEKMLDSGGGV